jgi:hypothetical protein
MKKLIWSMLFLVSMSMPLLTSCDKDDDKEDTDFAGTYTGTITVLDEGSNSAVTLSKSGEKYTLNLKDLKISVMGGIVIPIGDVQITDIAAKDGKLSGGQEVTINVTLPIELQMMPGGQENIDVIVSLKEGSIKENKLDFKLSIKNVPVLTTVDVDFTGTK